VALTVVLTAPARNARAMTSRTRSRDGRKSATRRNRNAPTSASPVLPAVIPSTVYQGTPVSTLPRSAPRAMAGHIRYPQKTVAASAIPVGGQTALMLSFVYARLSPSFAAP
jgi:hypothetical protein